MKTNIQVVVEKQRATYEIEGAQPLLQQICTVYQLTIREFAGIFRISKAHAEDIIKHRKFPALPLALVICRYFEVTVEDLFGWRIDDEGLRRPLVVIDQETKKAMRLLEGLKSHGTMYLVAERIKRNQVASPEERC